MRPITRASALLAACAATLGTPPALAAGARYNFQDPVTVIAEQIHSLHMLMLLICLIIFIAVFAVMFWSVYKHRKSKGAVAAHFHENTSVEIAWTVIPVLILLGMAWPATKTVLAMKDTSAPDITIKATGYQWVWGYSYLQGEGEGIQFISALSTPRAQIDRGERKGRNYLLEVDNPLVVPVGKKIRILTTANDVIHAWWVPAFGVKQDAIPGFIRDTWFRAEKEGVYRGNCAELCGKDHGFMPIEVHVLSAAAYSEWVKTRAATAGFAQQLYFALGEAALPADAAAAVKAAADYLAANAGAKLAITGYTDKRGGAEQNKELAKQRAIAVREALKAAGVAEARIRMEAPAEIVGGADDKAARRVEIKRAG